MVARTRPWWRRCCRHWESGDPAKVSRTVTLTVSDGAPFTPSTITVKRGETVRFIVKNSGKVPHEMVLGTDSQLTELYHTRMQAPGRHSTVPTPLRLGPEFSRANLGVHEFGTTAFGCLLPGHYDAGEKGTIIVQ